MVIKEKISEYEAKNSKYPDIIFMESHGMIVSSDDASEAMRIHDEANRLIVEYFNCQAFPECAVRKQGETYVSDTPFLKEYIAKNSAIGDYFDRVILYPDQIVYVGYNLGNTINVDENTNEIIYKTSMNQASTIEEVIVGVAYIIDEIAKNKLTLKELCKEGDDFIRNWESEKYRASLLK